MILCDTNVLGELAKRKPAPAVRRWAGAVHAPFSVSVVTVEEIWFGLAWRPNERVAAWLEAFLAHQCRVLHIDEAIAARAGRLRGSLRAAGTTRTQADMLIAATAVEHGLVLATRNVRDFEGCGVEVVNPFGA
jgi:predicted nucleic acid-binding protein